MSCTSRVCCPDYGQKDLSDPAGWGEISGSQVSCDRYRIEVAEPVQVQVLRGAIQEHGLGERNRDRRVAQRRYVVVVACGGSVVYDLLGLCVAVALVSSQDGVGGARLDNDTVNCVARTDVIGDDIIVTEV